MVSRICYRHWNLLASVFLLIACAPGTLAQDGAITLPLNLAEMTTRAALIVHARVTFAHVEPHPQYHNLASVVVTMSALDVLKGTTGKQVTFRQFIWNPRDIADRAGYKEGDELVLFLNRVTPAGFTSPVGLQQGRFRVVSARRRTQCCGDYSHPRFVRRSFEVERTSFCPRSSAHRATSGASAVLGTQGTGSCRPRGTGQ